MSLQISEWRVPIGIGLAGGIVVALTCGSSLTSAILPLAFPGITSDEPFSVLYGKYFVEKLLERGLSFFTAESINEVFERRSEHPPLGRWIIGWCYWFMDFRHIRDSRLAPALVFACMLTLVTRFSSKHYGRVAGVTAGVSLLMMPRIFAHAHFAALDTMVCWTYLMALISASWMMQGSREWLKAMWAGTLLGVAMLTKVHGILIIPLVYIWTLAIYGLRASEIWRECEGGWKDLLGSLASCCLRTSTPLLVWTAAGFSTFVVGWPWLWQDTFSRLSAFLGRTVSRQQISVSYPTIRLDWHGLQFTPSQYVDVEVPWHYPWVMFAITVPLGLHFLGTIGLWKQVCRPLSDLTGLLLFLAVAFPMLVFSLPTVPVYDGVRLFLMVFPFWAVFVGRGADALFGWLRCFFSARLARCMVGVLLVGQSMGIVHYHPFQLSYYNVLAGGLRRASVLGFEVTYWGDSITPELVDQWSRIADKNTHAALVPCLYPWQGDLYGTESTARKSQSLTASLDSYPRYLIVFNRYPYLEPIRDIIDTQEPLLTTKRSGIWLSAVYCR